MKGVLHRLATRAAGTAPLVRSEARLPFGGGGLAWADEPLDANGGSALEFPVTVAVRSDAAMQRAEPEYTHASIVTNTEASPEALAEVPVAPSLRQQHPRPAVTLPDAMLQAAEPSAPQLPISDRHDASQAAPEPRVREVAPLLATGMPGELDNRKPAPAAAPLPDGSSRRATAPPLVEPARLMPARVQVDASMPMIAPQKAARLVTPGEQTLDDATEVHIHIGRIEVTAVHEAPAPRTQPSRKQAPMSLDAYLAARSKT